MEHFSPRKKIGKKVKRAVTVVGLSLLSMLPIGESFAQGKPKKINDHGKNNIQKIDIEHFALLKKVTDYADSLKLKEDHNTLQGLEMALAGINKKFTFEEYQKWADEAKENEWSNALFAFLRLTQGVGMISQPSGLDTVPKKIQMKGEEQKPGKTVSKKIQLKPPSKEKKF